MNKGWVCPKCDKVLAPHIDECKKCNEEVGGYYPFAPAHPWDQTSPPWTPYKPYAPANCTCYVFSYEPIPCPAHSYKITCTKTTSSNTYNLTEAEEAAMAALVDPPPGVKKDE